MDVKDVSAFKQQLRAISTLSKTDLPRWVSIQKILLPGVQERLIEDPRVSVREKLALHPSLMVSVQKALLEDKHKRVLTHLALNPKIDSSTAHSLFASGQTHLLLSLARGGNLSLLQMREIIDGGQHPLVTEALALNPATPPEVLADLYEYGSPTDAWAVLENPNIPERVAEKALDTMPVIAASLVRLNEKSQIGIAKSGDRTLLRRLARNPYLTEATKQEIIKTQDKIAVEALARRNNLSAECLRLLLKNKLSLVYFIIADNPALPAAALQSFIEGAAGADTQNRACANPALNPELFEWLTLNGTLAQKLFLASNPSLPISMQRLLAKEEGPRGALMSNVSLVASPDFPLRFLLDLNAHSIITPVRQQIDHDVWEGLADSWEGTLNELLEVAQEIGKDE